jgi:hypothetical protein
MNLETLGVIFLIVKVALLLGFDIFLVCMIIKTLRGR